MKHLPYTEVFLPDDCGIMTYRENPASKRAERRLNKGKSAGGRPISKSNQRRDAM
jgi:hypothetical protein